MENLTQTNKNSEVVVPHDRNKSSKLRFAVCCATVNARRLTAPLLFPVLFFFLSVFIQGKMFESNTMLFVLSLADVH